MRKSILQIALCGILLPTGHLSAEYGFKFTKAGSAGLQFLKIDAGSRASALGGAVVSATANANAVFWNPAGIAHVYNPECQLTMNDWLVDSRYSALALAYPIGSTVLALSAIDFRIAEFEETTVLAAQGTGNMIAAGDIQIGLALARRFSDRLSIGGHLKYIQENLAEYSFDNILFDIGTIYYAGFRDLTFGFAFQHFGADMQFANQVFRTPLLFRVGISDAIFNTKLHKLTFSMDRVHPTDNVEWMNYGLEYDLLNLIALRLGYRQYRDQGDLSFGAGLNLPAIRERRLRVDYSFVNYGDIFGNISRLTLGITL